MKAFVRAQTADCCHCMRSAVKATYKRMGQLSYMTCVSSPSLFQVSAHSHAPTATEPSLTAPTCGPICRPTLRWRSTSVASALVPSVACLCCRNTAPQGAAPLGFETPKRQKGPTQSSGRWKGLVVDTSPAGLLTNRRASKGMTWPALRELEVIEPHYWTRQVFYLPSSVIKASEELPVNLDWGFRAGPNLSRVMQTYTWYQPPCCFCSHSNDQICSELIGVRGVLSCLCPGADQLRIMA